MKKELIIVVNKMIFLLTECNLNDKADWLQKRLKILKSYKESDREFVIAVMEIKRILAGMGSFSDLPVYPKKGSKLSEDEARKMQWDLVEEFDEAVIGIIGEEKHA